MKAFPSYLQTLICLSVMARCPGTENEDWRWVLDPATPCDHTRLAGGEKRVGCVVSQTWGQV